MPLFTRMAKVLRRFKTQYQVLARMWKNWNSQILLIRNGTAFGKTI